MSDLRKAAQQALRSLLDLTGDRQYEYQIREALRAITALQAALAEPEQEPVAWMKVENFIDAEGLWDERVTLNHDGDGKPLYTAPTPQHDTDCHLQGICQRSGYTLSPTPQRKPLTDEEIEREWWTEDWESFVSLEQAICVVRWAEARHGITGEGAGHE